MHEATFHQHRFTCLALTSAAHGREKKIAAPRVWTDRDLADWATPLAGLDVRPGHFSEREYHAAPEASLVRTYPVYFPGNEPPGYSESLSNEAAGAVDSTWTAY